MSAFLPFDILLPKEGGNPFWSVIACDQFTSEPEYWEKASALVGEQPSTLNLVYPEVWLGKDEASRIKKIYGTMARYLKEGVFETARTGFVYVERTLSTGAVRRGVVGVIDLEQYDFAAGTKKAIRATERTVTSRIPPRLAIRRGATLELSHVLLLADDREDKLLGSLEKNKAALPLLYETELMLDGGHLVGRLVAGNDAKAFTEAIASYEKAQSAGKEFPLLYCVGDGNHSLATAKTAFNEIKEKIGREKAALHPARFAMVELGNIADTSLVFEPIHRFVRGINPEELLKKLSEGTHACNATHSIRWVAGEKTGEILLSKELGSLPVAALQNALDRALPNFREAKLDYIHGEASLRRLAAAPNALGFLLSKIEKGDFFNGVESDGVLPRKTFSMGEATDKRYYTEARRILA